MQPLFMAQIVDGFDPDMPKLVQFYKPGCVQFCSEPLATWEAVTAFWSGCRAMSAGPLKAPFLSEADIALIDPILCANAGVPVPARV